MNTFTEIKPLPTTTERLKTNKDQLAELCRGFVEWGGVAIPINIITDLMSSFVCYEDYTMEQIKEVTIIMTQQIAFLASLGENNSQREILERLLKTESEN